MTFYIDPGTSKGCAVACFRGGALIGFGTRTERDGLRAVAGVFEQGPAVWEHPQMYPSRNKSAALITAQANDLIALAAAGSACANVLSWGRGGVRSVLPREWKRQIAKPHHHRHALALLSGAELSLVVEAYGKPLEQLDAYIRAGCLWVARNPGKKLSGYSAGITDLLDAMTLGLTEEGRLIL